MSEKSKNNAKMLDMSMYLKAGINPKTGLPIKYSTEDSKLQEGIKKALRIKDEQLATNRYVWYNTGLNITSQEIERLLYYKYSLVFFVLDGQPYLMPYALDGSIDFYGRENTVHPIPINTSNSDASIRQKKLLEQIKLNVKRGVVLDPTMEDFTNAGVIIKDYTPQMDITSGIPRYLLQDPIIDLESTIFPYLRTAMMNSTGTQAVQCTDESEASDILEAANAFDEAARSGKPLIPIMGKLNMQAINKGAVTNSEEYLMTMQGIDNFRESLYGTANGGLFTKKEHTNDSENALNQQQDFPLTDGLKLRQDACKIINSIWPCGIWCEISETAANADKNGDMFADDSGEPTNGTEAPEGGDDEPSEE